MFVVLGQISLTNHAQLLRWLHGFCSLVCRRVILLADVQDQQLDDEVELHRVVGLQVVHQNLGGNASQLIIRFIRVATKKTF